MADRTAIDRELGELSRRHLEIADEIADLLIESATVQNRAEVLLDRRLTETR